MILSCILFICALVFYFLMISLLGWYGFIFSIPACFLIGWLIPDLMEWERKNG